MADIYRTAHFETGTYVKNKTFLTDEEYSRGLDTFVKGCADTLLTKASTGEVLIGERKVQPQPDWWFIGGRMKAGLTPVEAAANNVRRETTLDIPHSRYHTVCHQSYVFQYRKQEPAGNGTADIACVFTVALTDEEAAQLKMCNEEYAGVKWIDPREVVNGNYHPALKRACSHLVSRPQLEALRGAATRAEATDAEVAALARAYFAEAHVVEPAHYTVQDTTTHSSH
mmetsp:Transcript_21036/g.66656  ORF Transcript_21036/g.66656 Transcript_21036/m.66656 type:complete len:227 (+) Transcript_21036:1052-1732(+)|eukprot:CAMPEP_0182891168 /NCGR_PEP_ID=MMETSP0034_2-20130328/23095_1 /TAXON_ID=156128 /ORGANISM="Nephroselmis pyriformis, Strain CCMP717" /LENGTH=226 /DNA_ID=CAMNT_0025024763 /DNA_START=68 /DNA_END=748 /DNA_ORIENTATION=-